MLKFRFYELGLVVGFRLSSKWDLGFPYFSWFATYPQLRWGFSGLPLSSSCIVVFSLLCSYVPSQTKSCFSILQLGLTTSMRRGQLNASFIAMLSL